MNPMTSGALPPPASQPTAFMNPAAVPRASGWHDVEHRREDVGVVETLEEPPHRERQRSASPTDEVNPQAATQGAPPRTPTVCTMSRPRGDRRRQRVRQPAADGDRRHAGELDEERRRQARHGQAHVKSVVEKLRHPRQQDDRDEVRAHERAHQAEERRRDVRAAGGTMAATAASRPFAVLDRAPRGGSIRNRAQHEPEEDASAAEDDERRCASRIARRSGRRRNRRTIVPT